jgi:hypothetical protein
VKWSLVSLTSIQRSGFKSWSELLVGYELLSDLLPSLGRAAPKSCAKLCALT